MSHGAGTFIGSKLLNEGVIDSQISFYYMSFQFKELCIFRQNVNIQKIYEVEKHTLALR